MSVWRQIESVELGATNPGPVLPGFISGVVPGAGGEERLARVVLPGINPSSLPGENVY